MTERWIQNANPKKGALHRQLGYNPDHKIPDSVLDRVIAARPGSKIRGHTITPLMKRRANFARNVRR